MTLNVIIELALGLSLVYLVLSLMVTAAGELLETVLKIRARYLQKALGEMLAGSSAEHRDDALEQFYNQPLIYALFDGRYAKDFWKRATLPCYIPCRTFATTLLDMAIQAGSALASPAAALGTTQSTPTGTTRDPQLDLIRAGVDALRQTHPGAAASLTTLLSASTDTFERLQASVENWFDATMERVSGRYKRHTQRISLALGCLLAVALNIDSLRIGSYLLSDPALRQALVANADVLLKSQEATSREETSPPVLAPVSAADARSPSPAPTDETADPTREIAQRAADVRRSVDALNALSLPIGWSGFQDQRSPSWAENLRIGLFSAIGWFITGLAASFGAPFWFDVLSRFTTVRATLKPQPKAA